MAGIDKAAIGWTIAIVVVGAGIAFAGIGLDTEPSTTAPPHEPPPVTPTMESEETESMMMEEEMESMESEMATEETESMMMEEEMESAMESEEMQAETGPQTIEVSIPVGSALVGCETTDECYIPASVSINAGDTVVWSNDDSTPHTVTSGTATGGPDGIFDSSLMLAEDVFEVTFEDSGSFDYYCIVHPWMTGTISVS